ncbi:hypothetical protein [Pyxidicoccus xibeiensis]|uniref:hypothetical protein n=1 Tax=Pyxidicoccus xibeiensis TaxID=2906759 RepID=UPI0020A6EAE9|nr:hypothetical protein [Pyxidicoccus xibeiensis]MCP3144874.1 hypothetical protein [Pyxidicoccus xibeiensis]
MKPSDFFIGIIDFLAVLLPGAVATFFLLGMTGGWLTSLVNGVEGWHQNVSIAFMAYLLGQIIFLLGSSLDPLYDIRRRRMRPKEGDKTFLAAKTMMEELSPELAGSLFSPFKWSKGVLQLQAPAARAEVDQLEASSKFFRSLTVMFGLAVPFMLVAGRPLEAIGCGVLSYACFRGFFDHRWKCTELAYAYVVLATRTFPPAKPQD